MQEPLRGDLDDKLRQIADMLQIVADGEPAVRRLLAELRASPGYAAPYEDPDPLVSVVIPTHTSYATLRDVALPSVLRQTHANFEVVVVGDNAPPETAEVIAGLGDPRIRYENLTLRGPYPQDAERRWLCSGTPPYNAAVGAARGHWIAPLGDDDAFLPDHVERLLADARERRLEFVYGQLLAHMPNGDTVLVGEFPPRIGEFGLQGALYHAGLKFLGLELSDAVFDLPNDWSLCRRMMRAGVRIGMVDAVVTDYYPSVEWGRRKRAAQPSEKPAAAPDPEVVRRELADALARVGALDARSRELEAHAQALQAHADDLQRRLDVMAGSHSWRVTRPLRAAAAQLRRR